MENEQPIAEHIPNSVYSKIITIWCFTYHHSDNIGPLTHHFLLIMGLSQILQTLW